jgi:hypothetical protein
MSWESIENYGKFAYGSKTFDRELLNKWLEGKNIKRWSSDGNHDVPKYLKKGRSNIGFPNHIPNKPPHMDHVTYFKSTNRFY